MSHTSYRGWNHSLDGAGGWHSRCRGGCAKVVTSVALLMVVCAACWNLRRHTYSDGRGTLPLEFKKKQLPSVDHSVLMIDSGRNKSIVSGAVAGNLAKQKNKAHDGLPGRVVKGSEGILLASDRFGSEQGQLIRTIPKQLQ